MTTRNRPLHLRFLRGERVWFRLCRNGYMQEFLLFSRRLQTTSSVLAGFTFSRFWVNQFKALSNVSSTLSFSISKFWGVSESRNWTSSANITCFSSFQAFPPQNQNFQKQNVRLITMADEYVYKISSRDLQKWLSYDINLLKQALFMSFWDYRDFPNCIFYRFWRFKKCYRVIFRVPCENLT